MGKKHTGNRPVINLKNLNKFVPYQNFQVKSLHCLTFSLRKEDYMCKPDLTDSYFSFLINEESRKLVNLYEFLCLFWSVPSTSFWEIFEIPNVNAEALDDSRHNTLERSPFFTNTTEEIIIARDCDFSSAATTLYHKPQKMYTGITSWVF